jgi:hypothetical protein
MSRRESDREDLLREATALVERAELQVPGFEEPIVVGFRRDGAASFFFGADPVYQFNAARELRRAFVGGLLLKAERGKLIELTRERSDRETALVRRELSSSETAEFLGVMQKMLQRLGMALGDGSFSVRGQWPAEGGVPERIRSWLAEFSRTITIANAPNVSR